MTKQLEGTVENNKDDTVIDAEYKVVDTAESDRLKAERREQFNADRATEKARRELDEQTRADKEKQERFDREQEDWNRRRSAESKDQEYQEEQKAELEKKRLKSFGEIAKEKISGTVKKLVTKKPETEAEKADRIKRARELEDRKMEYQHELRMKEMSMGGKPNKMSKGQFKASSGKSTKYIDPFPSGGRGGGGFPNVDPMGGVGGSGRNMMNFGMGAGVSRTSAKQQQQQRPQPPRPIRKPVDINAAFGNPFTGIIAASPKKVVPARTPNILKGLTPKSAGKGNPGRNILGLPDSKQKTSKKLKRMGDWRNF